jgi:pimeloyl-ACP methyl ester carboxylesterase
MVDSIGTVSQWQPGMDPSRSSTKNVLTQEEERSYPFSEAARTGLAWICSVILLLTALVAGCENSVFEIEKSSSGDILATKLLHLFSKQEILQILSTRQIPDSFHVSFSVEAIALTYQTTDAQGTSIRASGALLLPHDSDNLPILSIQHGTETKNDRVASVDPRNSAEGITGLLTASIGYLTCIPDYPGFGISRTPHPYLHAVSLTRSVVDLIVAAKSYCNTHDVSLNGRLFLTGYSEGGFATLAVQKELENGYSQELRIAAVAPMAGTYDLAGTADHLLQQSTYRWPTYIAFFFYAYDNVYRWNRLDGILNAPYSGMMRSLFDGSKTFAEINRQLPTSIPLLVNQNFINSYFHGNEHAVRRALGENTLLNWVPAAPIHFFHGDADDVAPFWNAVNAMESFRARGATNVQLTTIAGGTHESSGLPSIIGAIAWFESMRGDNQHPHLQEQDDKPCIPE